MNKHFIPALLLAATLVMAGCNEREIATSSTSKPASSQPQETSQILSSDPVSSEVTSSSVEPTSVAPSSEEPTSVAPSSEEPTSVAPSSEESVPASSEVPTSSTPSSSESQSSESQSSASSQEVVPVYVNWYVVGEGSFLNGGATWGNGGVRMEEMEDALGVAHVTFAVGDKFKVTNKSELDEKWLGYDAIVKGTAYADDQGGDHNILINQAGTYDVVLTEGEQIKILATGTTPVKEDPVPETLTHDYYVIGNMADSGWGANKEKYGMDKITSEDKVDYYRSDALELAAGVELKVVDQEKHNDKWFPNNNITITDAGTYYVYYLPSADGQGEPWIDGCVAVTLATADVPAIPSKSVEPPVHENVIHIYAGTTELELENKVGEDDQQNVAIYELIGAENTVITLKRDDDAMNIHHGEDPVVTAYTLPADGKYVFYVNNEYEVYVVGLAMQYVVVDMADEDFFEIVYENPSNPDQTVYTIHMVEGRGINFWHFETGAEVRYSYLMSNCNIDLSTDMFSQYFIANQEGDYTFTITKLELGFEVWVDGPQKAAHSYALFVNGTALNLAPADDLTEDEAEKNNAVYRNVHLTVTSDSADVLTVKDGSTVLHFYQHNELTGQEDDMGESLTAWASGTLTLWINKSNQVYYGHFQPDPAPAPSYNYYLVGAFNNYSLDGAPMFSAMGEESKVDGHTQYMVSEVTLTLDFSNNATNDFKVTGVPDRGQAHVHFPEEGSGHTLTQTGKYNVYFVPEGNSEWADTYFYFEKLSDGEPANVLKIYVEGEVTEAENIVEEGDTQNVAKYQFLVANGAKVCIARDGNPMNIHYGEADAVKVFTTPFMGKYTFYVNNYYEVYVVAEEIMYLVSFDGSDDIAYAYRNPGNQTEAMFTAELEAGDALFFISTGWDTVTSEYLDPESPADVRADLALTNFVVNQTGEYTFYIKTVDDGFSVYVTGPAKPVEIPVTEYYLIGGNADDGWTTLKAENKLTAMDDESKLDGHVQYHLDNVHLDQNGQYKIVGVTDGSDEWTWFPPSDGNGDNNYYIQTGGTYNVYFVAEGGHEAWSTGKGYMYCHLVEADAPAAVTYTDTLNNEMTGMTGTTYGTWSDKTTNSGSEIVYAGQSAGGNNSIQLRSNNSNSGIVVTGNTEGLKAKKVIVTFNSNTAVNRVVNIYASNTAYTNPTELYGNNSSIGSVTYNGTDATYEFEITGDYCYIGLRSNSGALYLDSVQIVWAA